MTWVLILVGVWLAVAVVAAVLIGRTVHTADVLEHTEETTPAPTSQDEDDGPPQTGVASFTLPRRAAFAER